eukprot:2441494-Alexandrium_andersonii.AAC.1
MAPAARSTGGAIRESGVRRPPRYTQENAPDGLGLQQSAPNGFGPARGAVSYTHLTLPTICSV